MKDLSTSQWMRLLEWLAKPVTVIRLWFRKG
jgi:hypothetical protein